MAVGLAVCIGSIASAAAPKVTRGDVTRRVTDGRAAEANAVRKASGLLIEAQALVAAGKTAEAVTALNSLVHMQLPANPEAQKLVADGYKTLGDIYRNDSAPAKAIQFYTQAIERMSPTLDSAAVADTQALITQLRGTAPEVQITNSPAPSAALDAGDDTCGEAVPVSIAVPYHEVFSINPAGDENWRSYTTTTASVVRIETNSLDIFDDDTTLTLYGSCSGSTPGDFIQFDDDAGPGFLSLIVTACMPAGTYFVRVGGFEDVTTVSDADLLITNLGSCVIPELDAFEPDNELAQASKIGFRNNGVGEGNQHGRNNNNIQHHSIFPVGDIDFVKFGLSRANFVRLETSGEDNPDTIMGLSFANGTLLAVNDDQAPGNFTSKLEVCLPSGDWRAIVVPFFGTDTFEYDWAVDVEHPCPFESEPNGAPATANTLVPGATISGIHTFGPIGENDFFRFTLTAQTQITLATSGYDIFDVDTTLDLFDSNGNLIATDEDGGDGFLSSISALLPAGTYYVNVWSFFAGYNFPYNLSLTQSEPPILESEPNASCATGNPVTLGDTVQAGITPASDIDSFHLVVPADGFVQIETTGAAGDTVLHIWSADGSTAVGCDDDAGDGFFSLWGCCLPAGEYCVQVEEFTPTATIPSYNIEFTGAGACTPSAPLTCPSTGFSCPAP